MMKLTTKILSVLLFILLAGLLASNLLIKQAYDKVDKNDIYWTYSKVLETPFKHLKIEGGNISKIAYEPSKNASVRVLDDWDGYKRGVVKAFVKNDTLFIKFSNVTRNIYEKNWIGHKTLIRIFSPELLSVDGYDTKFEMFKLKQKSLSVKMAGKSAFEAESLIRDLDDLTISQKDSSIVVFERTPEGSGLESTNKIKIQGADKTISVPNSEIKSKETLTVQNVTADVKGVSLLDLGHAQIGALKLDIADSSAIILSGGALKIWRK